MIILLLILFVIMVILNFTVMGFFPRAYIHEGEDPVFDKRFNILVYILMFFGLSTLVLFLNIHKSL